MKEFSVKELARIIKAQPTKDSAVFTGISTDSRTIRPGDCFFAIEGENFDGHDYVRNAFDKGAACAVVGKDTDFAGSCLLRASDPVKALGDFAAQYRRQHRFKVVAITGSVGKTTTRRITHHILSRYFRTFQAPKNFNNDIGLPLTLLGADPDHEIIVAEIGGNRPGEIAQLARIAQPDVAVITNVYPAHLAGFGNLKTIIDEKSSIAEPLPPHGALIINGSFDRLIDACLAKTASFTTFGKSDNCDIQGKDIIYDGSASRFTINGTEIHLPLPGPGNVENALAAWAICRHFGLTIADFAQTLKTAPPAPMRAELLQIGTLTVLNDCYNANPASMQNALHILRRLASSEKRRSVFICGDMAELGNQSRLLHAELGKAAAGANISLLLAVGRFAKAAAQAAKENTACELDAKCFENTDSACNSLAEFIKDYDIVLVKGSRSAGLEKIVEKLKQLHEKPVRQVPATAPDIELTQKQR